MSTKKLQIIGNIGGGSSVGIDTTLTQSGRAADAKVVGDALLEKVDQSSFNELVGDTPVAEQIENAISQQTGIVRYDTPQTLDRTQKNLTRNNTGSVGFDDIYKTEAVFNFTWDGNVNGKDTITIGNSVYCKVSDSAPDFYSIYSAMSETTNGETNSLLQEHLGFYNAGCGMVVEKAGRCVFLDRVDDGEFTAPSTGVYFLCSDDNADVYQKSLSLSANGTVTLTYTWSGSTEGKDTFEYNAYNYYKISDDVFDFKMISGASLKHSHREPYDYSLYNGINCYNAGNAIIVTKAGLCKLSVNNFDEYMFEFTAPSTGIYFWKASSDHYDTELNLIINGKHGIYLNSEANNSFTIGITDNGTITTEDESGAITKMIASPESAEVGQVLSVKSVDNNGNIIWETINPEGSIITDDTLTIEGSAADAKVTGDRLSVIESKIADLLYEAINITSFSNNVGTVEKGSTVTNVTLSWKTNKTPTTLKLDGESVDVSSTSVTSNNLSITSDKTWTLKATDERGVTSEKTTKITFLNGVYYGAVNSGAAINNSVILGLTKKLQSTKTITFTTTANAGQHIVFALPASYGTPAFNVGGFDGGFSLNSTFNFENSSGYTTSYCVWISDNVGLGETTVKVS